MCPAEVPPGHFLEMNVVRACPVGMYRKDWVKVTDKKAISCVSCQPGYTTDGIASASEAACNSESPDQQRHNLLSRVKYLAQCGF